MTGALILLLVVSCGCVAWQAGRRAKAETECSVLVRTLRKERSRNARRILTVPFAPDWTSADNLNLGRFLKSESGQKLLQRAIGREFHETTRACADPMHTVHSAARAAGFGDFRRWLESLASAEMLEKISQSSGEQEEQIHQSDMNESATDERVSFA